MEIKALIIDKDFLSGNHRLSCSIDDYPEGIIIPVDKPYRWTSADVIRKVKWAACRHFHKKNLKVGHAGTLDPLATGVLLVCIGKATKLAETLQKEGKEYLAGVSFGATTPSYDLEKAIDKEYPTDNVSEESVRAILPQFLGGQEQIAPLFSAKSVDGVRAYELARKQYREAHKEKTDVMTDFDHTVAETSQQTDDQYLTDGIGVILPGRGAILRTGVRGSQAESEDQRHRHIGQAFPSRQNPYRL